MRKSFNKNKGFTLAETLITLVIIGIIAAITVPTLINNYKKNEYVTRLKSFYSIFENGLNKYVASQGATSFSQTDLYAFASNGNFNDQDTISSEFNAFVNATFKTIKYCPWGYSDMTCYIEHKSLDKNNIEYGFGGRDGYTVKYYLTNSMMIAFLPVGRCIDRDNRCFDIDVDINGKTGPNVSGRDYFRFAVDANGKLLPSSYYNVGAPAESYCSMNSTTNENGCVCSAKIIKDNWEMNY